MTKRVLDKFIIGIVSIFLFIGLVLCFIKISKQKCFDLPVISEESLLGLEEVATMDLSQIAFEGERAAVDYLSNSIFISQSESCTNAFDMLQGKFTSFNSGYKLAILDTPELHDIPGSISGGMPLTLVVLEDHCYQKVNVKLSTLPIMNLKFEYETIDDRQRNINVGKMTLWNNYFHSASYQTVTSAAEWRVRGNSTRSYPKQPWKLNLREVNGENSHLDLLGLGSDDDWILNPLSMDDTKMKEKLAQELWKQNLSETDYNYPMSSGEYVEVLINGAYQGLYLLQRRIDAKFLSLDLKSDILLKGNNIWETEDMQEAYEIVHSPLSTQETYQKFNLALKNREKHYINGKNFVDINLFLQFLSANDNYGYKNMFYLLKKSGDGYELSWIPWDTDLSLGVVWGYDYDTSVRQMIERRELSQIRESSPQIDILMSRRWEEARKTVYSEKMIFSICDQIAEHLSKSGALKREEERWGKLHEDNDSYENLKKFIMERLEFLDSYYAGLASEEEHYEAEKSIH